MRTENHDSFLEKLSHSRGSKKIKNYFLDLIDREDFQEKVAGFRKKYSIPKDGFVRETDSFIFKGVHLAPKEWKNSNKASGKFWIPLLKDVNEICRAYRIPTTSSGMMLEYLMFSAIDDRALEDLLTTQDVFEIGDDPESDAQKLWDYPIAIRVSPYANKRVILNYIEIAFTKKIKPLLEKYKAKKIALGRTYKKDEVVRKRNTLIFELHEKGCKWQEIKKVLKDAGYEGYFGQSEIERLLSSERKRRRKV